MPSKDEGDRHERQCGEGHPQAVSNGSCAIAEPPVRRAGASSPGTEASAVMSAGTGTSRHRLHRLRSCAGAAATTFPRRRTTACSHAWTASSSRWVETRTAEPVARSSSDHVHRGLDAQRVDAVERLVQQQHLRFVEGSQQHGHPSSHAVGEPSGDPVGDAEQVEPVQQVGRPGSPSHDPCRAASRPAGGAPRVWRGGSAHRHQGSSRRARGPGPGGGPRRPRRSCTVPVVGGRTPASTFSVVDLPAPLRPTRASVRTGRHGQVESVDGDDRAEGHREAAGLHHCAHRPPIGSSEPPG